MSTKYCKVVSLLLALCMLLGTAATAETIVTPQGNTYGFADTNGKYYTDYMTLAEEQQAARELAIEVATEGFVMLKNENNALPLKAGSYVSLFGMHSVNLIPSTSGSAAGKTGANGLAESTLQDAMELAGFKVNPKLIDLYTRHEALGTTNNELPVSYYSNATISTYNGYGDAAVVVFSRSGSEAKDKQASNVEDHADPTDHELMLDDNEKALIKHVKAYYPDKPIIVLINSSNILQIPELNEPKATSEYGVDAIFWVGNTGNNAIEAIGKLLSGEVNPSGHTSDIWEKDFTQGPSWTNFGQQSQNLNEDGSPMDAYFYYEGEATKYATIEYREGIYIGYRYYETAYDDAAEGEKDAAYANVLYPFGYGLSYTTFDWELAAPETELTISNAHRLMRMQVKVTNTGNVAGKDVVQVYANPPYTVGGIEKASANLVGFAKTDLLQPGESEIVTIEWIAQDMASFDWNDANANGFIGYELEAGDYIITARRNSHDVVLTETYQVAEDIRCTTDSYTGKTIEALFVDDFTTVNDSLLNNMISRTNGLKQPESASVADRTIDSEYLALIDAQYTYRSYMDQGYEPWYVNEDGIPSTWTQEASREEGEVAPIAIQEMTGVDFTLDIVDGAVVQGDDEGSKKWEAFMNQLTWEEMASLVDNGGGTQAISAVGVTKVGASETPLQLSGGTMWACPPILAASFNLELAEKVGVMMGNEALFKGCSYWQGNALNIHRSPLSGRNVEYYSQDGVHSGKFSAAVLQGITSKGVTCFIKHMMLNDQESYRDLNGGVFTWATEQVIREIYAKPFEYSLKQGHSTGIMGSFNRIGNINAQLNLALKNLVRVEWDNRAIFETDAWQGTYCPVDLMVRQGNNQVLGSGEAIPAVGLEYGAWDAEGNCVRVSDGGDGTFLSQTHYAAVRKSAQEILWNFCNGNGIKNGYSTLDACVLEFDSYAKQSLAITYAGVDFQQLELADGSELPAGFTLNEGVISSDGSVSEGEWNINVKLTGIDGYITLTAPVVIRMVDPIHVSQTELKVGQAADVTINAPYYAYSSSVTVNAIYVNTITDLEGNPVQGQWYPGGGRGSEGTAKSTGDSIGGSWRILNWYWKDASQLPAGNTYDCVGHLAFADIEATDARYIDTADVLSGNYYKAFPYEFRMSDEDAAKLADFGLTVEKVMTNHTGYQGVSYDVNTGLKLTGTPAKAGEVTVTVTVQIPLVMGSRFPNFYARMSPVVTEITRTVTLTIGE